MMRFDRFTERAQDAAQRAAEIIQRYGHNQIDTEHLMLALLEQPEGTVPQILRRLEIDVETLAERIDQQLRSSPKANIFGAGAGQIFITPRVKRVIDLANEEANRLKDEYISTEHLFLAILSERNTAIARRLGEEGITKERIYEVVREIRGVTELEALPRYRTLERFAKDLNREAKSGRVERLVGRRSEVKAILEILTQRRRNKPLLVGYAGVGKTAIVNGLAYQLEENEIPGEILGGIIMALNHTALVSGARDRADLEDELTQIMEELVRGGGDLILFLDDMDEYFQKNSPEYIHILHSLVSHDEVRLIGAISLEGYRRYVMKDAVLERHLAPIFVKEPTVEETVEILKGHRDRYEAHHKLVFSEEALAAASSLTSRFVPDRKLPEKAIDCLDAAAARLRISLIDLPPELETLKREIGRLGAEEEMAGLERDYERAAEKKSERLHAEHAFREQREAWQAEQEIDEIVTDRDIAEIVARWTGISVEEIMVPEWLEDPGIRETTGILFISYSRRDEQFAHKLNADLKSEGITTWIDEVSLRSGEHWPDQIAESIEKCRAVLAVISPDSVASRWVKRELEYADKHGKDFVPLLYRQTELPEWFDLRFGSVQWVDFTKGSYSANLALLIETASRVLGG